MKYVPKSRKLWEYTGEESARLNARHFSREKTHKHSEQCHKSGCDLFERMPLWEIMEVPKWKWDLTHWWKKTTGKLKDKLH